MTSTRTVTVQDGTTTAIVDITSAWPYTSACSTQFALLSGGLTSSISAYDPGLGGQRAIGPTPLSYAQTQCLPSYFSQLSLGYIGSVSYQFESIVCPQSWSLFTSPDNTLGRPTTIYSTCCPPKYTLSCSQTFKYACASACFSPVTSGQTIVGIPYFLLVRPTDTNSAFPTTYTASTFVASRPTVAQGYMISGYSTISYPSATYTYNSGGSSSSNYYDDANAAYSRYLGLRLGLGIGIPLVFLIISGIILFMLIRKRKRRAQAQYPQGNSQGNAQNQYKPGAMSNTPGQPAGLAPSNYGTGAPNHYPGPQSPPHANQYQPSGQNQYGGPGANQYQTTQQPQYGGPGSNQYQTAGQNQFGGVGPNQYSETVPNQHAPSSPHQYAGGLVNRDIVEAPAHPSGNI